MKNNNTFINSLGMSFVLLPAGTFHIGSNMLDIFHCDSEIQHQVTFTAPFYLQTTQVTQGQWQAVMGCNPSINKDSGLDCPVECVSWEDVQEFIQNLNRLEGTTAYRLPTEAQWEYACYSGGTGFHFVKLIFDEDCPEPKYYRKNLDRLIDTLCWYDGNSDDKTHPVAQKRPNFLGIYDMHGNVMEWCQDYLGEFSSEAVTDPRGPEAGEEKVVRGGCYLSKVRQCRCTERYGYPPDTRSGLIGFRLAKDP